MDRRSFFRSLLGRTAVVVDELNGRPHLQLREVPSLSEQELDRLRPRISPEIEILPAADFVRARRPDRDDPVVLFESTPINLRIFNKFDGCNSLSAIRTEMAGGGADAEAVLRVDELFFKLLDLGVCAPANY